MGWVGRKLRKLPTWPTTSRPLSKRLKVFGLSLPPPVPQAVHLEVAHGEVEPMERVVDVVDVVDKVAGEVSVVNRSKDQRDFVFVVAATNIWLKHVRRPIPPQSLSLKSNARSVTRPGPGMRSANCCAFRHRWGIRR